MKNLWKESIPPLLILLVVLFAIQIPVFAHAGNTDENGGHYDADTGEYHYHHGYPAHDHYDIDGDGAIDCPYDFDDKTGQNSGSSSSSISKKTTSSKSREVDYLQALAIGTILVLASITVVLAIMNQMKRGDIDRVQKYNIELKEWHNKTMEMQKSAYEEALEDQRKKLGAENAELEEQIRSLKTSISEKNSQLCTISDELKNVSIKLSQLGINETGIHIPRDICFSEDFMPIYYKPDSSKPYGDYTVFFNRKNGIYHVDRCCASYDATTTHIFNVIGPARPCRRCATRFFDFTDIPDWYKELSNRPGTQE